MSSQTSVASLSDLEIPHQNIFTSNILPVLDYLSQIFLPFQAFEFIQIIFCVIQIIETSFWTSFGTFWHESKFLNIMHYISFFTSISPKTKENAILCSIFLAIILIDSLLFCYLILHFSKTRRINRPILVIQRIYSLVFSCVIIHPLASLAGHLFVLSITYQRVRDIILLILAVIGFILSLVLFYINQKFVNQSIYIHKSLWITFDSTLLLFFFLVNPVFLFLDHVFIYYPKWSSYLLITVHILMAIIALHEYTWMAAIDDIANSLQVSTMFSLIFNGFFRIIAENFKQKIKQEIYVITCVAAFIIFFIVFFIITKLVRKKIKSQLSFSKFINPPSFAHKDNLRVFDPTMEGKFVYFTELKLDKNVKRAMIYLITGFTSASEMFTDFSLVQFCIDNYKTNQKMLALLIHLLAYFKKEKKRLNIVLEQFNSLRSDYIYGNFLYMQAYKIKIFRQVTSTNSETDRLNNMKLFSRELENHIKSFWALSTANTNTLEKLEKRQRHLNYLWDECIEENWASEAFREEHIHFLIEVCTSYQKAVQMECIKDKINILRRERNDLCFLSLLFCIPAYKRKLYDSDRLADKLNQKSSSSGSSITSLNDKFSSTDSDYDLTQDELIANSLITYGKLRLSMENTLKNVKPKMSKLLMIYSIVSILTSLIMIIITYSLLIKSFDSFDDWNREVGVVVDLRLAYVKTFLSLSIYAGKATNRFFFDSIECNKTVEDERNSKFLNQSTDFDDLSLLFVDEARERYNNLIESIVLLALRNVNISTLSSILFDSSINSTICNSGKIIDYANWSLEKTLNFDILSFAILSDDKDVLKWYSNNKFWCHAIMTFPEVSNAFSIVQNELSYDLSNSSMHTVKRVEKVMHILGPSHFVLFIIPLPIIIYFNLHEINHLIKIILSINPEYKEQARRGISISSSNEQNEIIPAMAKVTFNWKLFIFSFLIIVFFVFFILFEELILFFYKSSTQKLRNIGYFKCYFSTSRVHIFEILINMLNAVYFIGLPDYYITNSMFRERIYYHLKEFEKNVYEILNNTPDAPSSIGQDSTVDHIVLISSCDNPEYFTHLHDSYVCASLSRLFATFHSMVEKYTEEINIFNGIYSGEELNNLYHIVFVHLTTLILEVSNRFEEIQNEEVKQYKINLTIFFLSGIVFLLIWLFLMIFIINNFKRIFEMAICLIRRISPANFINSNELINYILYKKSEEIEMGVTHAIFNNSFDGIICMNHDGIVEIINKSFANDYGYSTEQLVGQLIGTIFDSSSREKIETQLALIKNHESSMYKQDVICFTNNGQAVPSFITLFAIKGIENSLILVIRDQTILLQKKKRLELAKKQSQDLLEQIMPPKVLMMMKEGKSEITFAVPSASVMFVDIVNFSKFTAELSPQQIMLILSTLFGAFDVWIQKYPLMTKIKLIGDIYMAASGLFASDEEPHKHAKQCIDFAIHVLNILDDTNIKLNVFLQIRIGVNSDGPLIAGVLGTENRVFDIIGDTINVASRLEHKADPGHILMSEKTYDLIKNDGYNIIPKGKVFLKGKGDMEAYSI